MREALERAAEQFEYYAEQHTAKGTEDANRKAAVNVEMAAMCRDALKPTDRIMSVVDEAARDEPAGEYPVFIQPQAGAALQSYKQVADLELANKAVNLIAPHWNKTVRNAAADSLRLLFRQELTRMWLDVVQFHHKFKRDYSGPPRRLPVDQARFRLGFLQEELNEYAKAFGAKPVWQHKEDGIEPTWELTDDMSTEDSLKHREDMLDALVDLVYVALGTAYLHGFNFAEAWRRVQRANMAKTISTNNADSKRGNASLDVIKPPGWTAPSHLDLVGETEGIMNRSPVQHDLF